MEAIEKIREILEQTNLPVAYESFTKDETPPLPFICYTNPEDNNFAADGTVYHSSKVIHVELYTEKRDLEIEKAVEAVLSAFFYEKTAIYLNDEKCYEILYELEV